MPGLVPGIHVYDFCRGSKAWMAESSPAMAGWRRSFPKISKWHVGIALPRSSYGRSEPEKRNLRMSKISPCLWFDGEAEEAAKFYVSLLPDSRIEKIQKNTVDGPAGKAGSVLVVDFTLAGQRFMALNGGMRFEYTHAVSFKIDCVDQAEVDRLWDALSANGGSVERCGWLKDRFGVSWQIVPTALVQYLGGPDAAGAKRAMQAMMQMVKLDIAGLKRAYEGKSAA
jgi:predicted 3-demethylubiquinone-9 3-methyltransferase (glyoxalase superfamily)